MDHQSFKLDKYKMKETRVFRDVIHGYITVDYYPIWQLINTRAFQRLRRIKQLGGTCMVFHTAEHSRFVHSLGVYEIVRKMLQMEEITSHLNDYQQLTVLCAALLHDIGHGPYSHSFEQVMEMPHETMSIRIILEDEEISGLLSSVHQHLPQDVANVLRKKADKPLMVQMISSQLDADRMDYLLRDSYFAGVTYGQFDMSRILRTLRVKDERIVFKESGVQAIEDYILARYYMYWQVYYHPVGLSYEHIFHSIMTRIRDLAAHDYVFKTDMNELAPLLKNQYTVEQYISLDESVLTYYIQRFTKEDDFILSDLSKRFVNRRLLKFETLKDHAQLDNIKTLSDAAGYDHRYYVADEQMIQVLYVYDAPGTSISEIEILKEDGTVHSLMEESEIVQAIVNGKPKQEAKVFFVRELKEVL